MSTYYEDLKMNNPAKYADRRIAGTLDKVALKNMIRALSILPLLNTNEDEIRLAAAKRLIRNRY
jgi:hypothetical protein